MCPLPAFLMQKRRTVNRFAGFDADAAAYLQAVEAADSQQLETQVLSAFNSFFVGLKSDGLWSSIGAMCVFAGARTLAGALVPIVGPSPSNNAFLAADYNRKTGLIGNGSTKYLDSGYSHTTPGQNDRHMSVWVSARVSSSSNESFIGTGSSGTNGSSNIGVRNDANSDTRFASATGTFTFVNGRVTGFHGTSRSASGSYTRRVSGGDATVSQSSQTPASGNVFVFANNFSGAAGLSTVRLYHYSIGPALTLATLESRIATLKTALDAFLP